jgi:PAS domain S-box-containing protein
MADASADLSPDDLTRIRDRVAELGRTSPAQLAGFLEALLSALPAVVLRFDPELKIRFVSRLVPGLREEQVIGAPALDFISPEDHERARETIATALSSGRPGGYETIGPGPNGERRTYQVFVAPVTEVDGRTGGCFVAIDTSQMHARERALAASEQKLRIALAATKVGLWSWDLSSGELIWDERMQQLMGRTTALTLEEYVAQAVHPDDRDLLGSVGGRAMTSGRFEATPHRIVRPDGEVRWMLTVGEIERDANGRPVRVMGGNLDITEQRALEEQLLRARQMEVVGRLTAGVAHNFNNMLMTLLPSLELLRGFAPESNATLLGDALDAAEQAAEMVRKLMTFAGQRRPTTRHPCDVSALAERVVGMCARTFDRHITIRCETTPEPAFVSAAPVDLEQVLMNLLLNARDAMLEAQREHPRVDVIVSSVAADPRVSTAGPLVEVRVRDNGIGMSEHVKQHAFEPFFTRKDVGSGTGLGLATSYALVRDLGGHIGIESTLGQGTTVSVLLPKTSAPEELAQPTSAGSSGPSGTKVLVIDDEPQILRLVDAVLSGCGCGVRTASDGPTALTLLAREPADVILLDRSMPSTPGAVLLGELRGAAPAARIAYFTGQEVSAEDSARVDAVVHKPVRVAELERVVTELAATRRRP